MSNFTITRPLTTSSTVTHQNDVTISVNSNFNCPYRRLEVGPAQTTTFAISTANATRLNAHLLGITATANGTINVQLPSIATLTAQNHKIAYTIVDEGGNAGNNNITVSAVSDDLINGATGFVMNQNYESIRLYSVPNRTSPGTNPGKWFIAAVVPS